MPTGAECVAQGQLKPPVSPSFAVFFLEDRNAGGVMLCSFALYGLGGRAFRGISMMPRRCPGAGSRTKQGELIPFYPGGIFSPRARRPLSFTKPNTFCL